MSKRPSPHAQQIRRSVLRYLFEKHNFTIYDAATAIGISDGAIRNDVDHLVAESNFKMNDQNKAPTKEQRQEKFGKALVEYSRLQLIERTDWSEFETELNRALGNYISLAHLRGIAAGITASLKKFTARVENKEWLGYEQLLNAIFTLRRVEIGKPKDLFCAYLSSLLDENTEELPTRATFANDMNAWACRIYNMQTYPMLDATAVQEINETLGSLDPNLQTIIRLRFGLGCDNPKSPPNEFLSLEHCAELLDFSRSRAGRLETKALRQMRADSRSGRIIFWATSTLSSALKWQEYQRQLLKPPISDSDGDSPDTPKHQADHTPLEVTKRQRIVAVLNRSIEAFDLSTRSYNCLKYENIKTIGDLVQKTERQMLRIKNFGRKSLNEIKEYVLNPLGLRFDMNIDLFLSSLDKEG